MSIRATEICEKSLTYYYAIIRIMSATSKTFITATKKCLIRRTWKYFETLWNIF